MDYAEGFKFKCLVDEQSQDGNPGDFQQVVYCKLHQEVCCSEGCCPLQFPQMYFYTWEILIVMMMICLLASVFICVYCYRLCRFSNVSIFEDGSIANIVASMEQNGGNSEDRAPPPIYEVAINLPPYNPDNVVPSYEEAVKKLGSLK